MADHLRDGGWRLLNLGVSGSGPLIQLAELIEYAEPLRPKSVVWMYYEGNDLGNLAAELGSEYMRGYIDGTSFQNLRSRQPEVDQALRDFVDVRYAKRSRTTTLLRFATLHHAESLIRRFLTRFGAIPTEASTSLEVEPQLREILSVPRDRVAGWGGRYLFVYLPGWHRYAAPDRPRADTVFPLLSELGIDGIDFRDTLSAFPDPLEFFSSRRIVTHYTPEGYRMLADQIAARLAAPE